jgi:hypothetical protein
VQTSIKNKEMVVCAIGLYLISSEKGYLCYYPFEKIHHSKIKETPLQFLELCISSNILYIHTNNLLTSTIYKLRLANKPTLTSFATKTTRNVDKLLKFAFYKK